MVRVVWSGKSSRAQSPPRGVSPSVIFTFPKQHQHLHHHLCWAVVNSDPYLSVCVPQPPYNYIGSIHPSVQTKQRTTPTAEDQNHRQDQKQGQKGKSVNRPRQSSAFQFQCLNGTHRIIITAVPRRRTTRTGIICSNNSSTNIARQMRSRRRETRR